ncbi:SagB/ThcOx family dehydrogenase [Pseudomonas sp. NEEL19]|uniref:SagB/ThcOx family dehydrogenase n=1 Tax=Pseudomonas sp. NEEL19 TaxID=2867409 RepID=UPI002368E2F3|nr:SagB/ThcOx family dehydrogenase [Pseudomonas sp. NEEL19]WDM60959.1 SagB/ThcOx family dehydrogenase [Pseudomonas sp. NEEL19]
MTLPHDYYLKFVSSEVLDETLAFHAKGNYTIHTICQHASTLHHIPSKELEALTGNELPLNILEKEAPDQYFTLSPLKPEHYLKRNESCDWFVERPLDFETIQSLTAPLLTQEGHSYKRGYPSGGAIYPIEVFFVNLDNRISRWPSESNVLHLLPSSKTFETNSPQIDATKLTQAIIPKASNIGRPALALLYIAYLPKALFKYRYRGYRLALMEAGSMYMLIDLRCKELNLQSRPWSGFTDYEITKCLKLNPALFTPLCVQFVG